MKNKWLIHVKETYSKLKKKNKNTTLKEAIIQAKKTYKSK
jgi:hypothetical protein